MGTVDFYDKIYTKRPNKWCDLKRDKFVSDVLKEPETLLDFGCGNGHTIEYLSTVWKHTKFVGVDISGIAINIALSKFIPNSTFYVSKQNECPFMPSDVILCMGVLEHIENPILMLANLRENLKNKGIIYLEVPNCLAYSESKDEGFRIGGSSQVEWHLKRETWEREVIGLTGLKIKESLTGQRPPWEFIWLLGKD